MPRLQEPTYPPLITLLQTHAIPNTVDMKLTGDQVHCPEDLPRRLIVGLLDPKSFHYSEADGQAEWHATWKSWGDELRLEVSWTAGGMWMVWVYWKDSTLLGGGARSDAPFSYVLSQLAGLYTPMIECPYSMGFTPETTQTFFLPDGLLLTLFIPIHAAKIKDFWTLLETQRERLVTDVTVRAGLVRAEIGKPARRLLEELAPEAIYQSTGVGWDLIHNVRMGECVMPTRFYLVTVHCGLSDLPLMQSIWRQFPPERPYFRSHGMAMTTALEVAMSKKDGDEWTFGEEDWRTSYRMDSTLRALLFPRGNIAPAYDAVPGLAHLERAIAEAPDYYGFK